MRNKLLRMIRQYDMMAPGDTVICAVSGGADSVALLFAMYLLRDKLDIRLEAAHFNHHLRGEESDGDEAFVREFCGRYDIPLHVGSAEVHPGKKGLEAAARDARYAFLRSLNGKIATAHTADDNAETVIMRMIRGTGPERAGRHRPGQRKCHPSHAAGKPAGGGEIPACVGASPPGGQLQRFRCLFTKPYPSYRDASAEIGESPPGGESFSDGAAAAGG